MDKKIPCVPCVPWIILVAYGKKSLEEIFNEIWPLARNQSSELRWIFLVAYGKKYFRVVGLKLNIDFWTV